MAYQMKPVKVPARGDAPNTGAPGPTPAPTSASLALSRDRSMGREGYGANAWGGASSDNPGKTTTSPLADALKAKNAEADGGDLLQRIIERGTARGVIADVDLQSPQTRDVSRDQYPAAHGQVRRSIDAGSPGGVVPSVTGHSPMADEARRRAAQLKNAQ